MELVCKTLKRRKGKSYAEMIFFGDLHLGSQYCDLARATKMLQYCLDNKIYVLCMGDMIEASNRYSVGSGVYEQINPTDQVNGIIDILKPLADAGLIIAYLSGNHDQRIAKETGVDISNLICKTLNVPYMGSAGWLLLQVGKQKYSIFAMHGSTGARFKYSKMKVIIDASHYQEADIVAMGHTHDLIIDSVERQTCDKKNSQLVQRKSHIVITGHYHKYGGYVLDKCYPLSKMGSPKAQLWSNKFDIHISI